MQKIYVISLLAITGVVGLLLSACGNSATIRSQSQATPTINSNFQSQSSPVPAAPTYTCGSWSSNNAPGPDAIITIYAKLVKNVSGVGGASATAIVHFSSGDVTLDQQPVSDAGGYVKFTLPLQGRQASGVPATVDVTFTNFPGGTTHCTHAFFTPQ